MIQTIAGVPDPSYRPFASPAVSPDAYRIPARLILDRLEGYTGRLFGPREVTWLIDGPAVFRPPLGAVVATVELYNEATRQWELQDIVPGPRMGFDLDRSGQWMLTGTAGSPEPLPQPFAEAYLRLAEYLAAGNAAGGQWAPGIRSYTASDGGVSITQQRAANWQSDAFRLSGAADVLRYHRRPR